MIYLSLKSCPPCSSEQRETSKAQIRELLGSLGYDPELLKKNDKGRPVLLSEDADVSISHTSGMCAAAVLTEKDVDGSFTFKLPMSGNTIGIDIEQIPDQPDVKRYRRIAKRFLGTDNIDDAFEFFRLWTRKEAYGKMVGDGFFSKEGIPCHISTYTVKTDNRSFILSISVK